MGKFLALLNVYRKGSIVANPVAWKHGQITASVITGFLAAIVAACKTFGYQLPVTDDQLLSVGGIVVAIAGLFLNPTATVVSSDKVGLPTVSNANEQTNSPISGH